MVGNPPRAQNPDSGLEGSYIFLILKLAMELYSIYFAALALFNASLAWYRHLKDKNGEPKESLALPAGSNLSEARRFKIEYFGVFALVVTADWLQVGERCRAT